MNGRSPKVNGVCLGDVMCRKVEGEILEVRHDSKIFLAHVYVSETIRQISFPCFTDCGEEGRVGFSVRAYTSRS